MNKKVTINDVAHKAGVAKSTVSRAFTLGESVSSKTRDRVLDVARELGYEPNPLAQALSVSATRTVAIVVPNIESIHISQITRGVISELSKQGYSVVIADSSENFGVQAHVSKPLSNQLVDAIINCYGSASEEIEALSHKKTVVCVGDRPSGYRADYVGIDYEQGYVALCRHLERAGIRRLCLINGLEDESAMMKSKMFRGAADENGLTLEKEDVYYANWTPRSGHQTMETILASGRIVDAVVCASDMVAFGAMKAACQHGIRIPQDLSFCGMDDSMTSKYTIPSLTTLKFSPFRLGKRAAQMVLERLGDPGGDVQEIILPVDVEQRNSVRPARGTHE